MNEPRRPPPPFDLSIVTGFLGAGKTTLLNRLLRDPALAGTLVLINEFGSVGLDHLLVERVEGEMLVMTSGCLCCTIRGELVATLEDALRARDNGRAHWDRVVIETTGLADPAPVLHTVMAHPYLALRFHLRAVVTLVDAVNGMATLDRHREAVRQVALADRLVLTKADLAEDAGALGALRERLGRLNPAAPLLDVAEATAGRLFGGAGFSLDARGDEARAWLAAEAVEGQGDATHHHAHHAHAHHGHDHAHADHAHAEHLHAEHDVNRHDASIRSFCLRHPRPVPVDAVMLFTELLRTAHGAALLRLKGLIATDDDPERPVVVHGVQHVMHPPRRLERWPDADRGTRMVFITDGLDERFVRELWAAAAGEPRPDAADLATRLDNPLAPARGGLLG